MVIRKGYIGDDSELTISHASCDFFCNKCSLYDPKENKEKTYSLSLHHSFNKYMNKREE